MPVLILLFLFCFSAPSAMANPYEMSGHVFDILAVPVDGTQMQVEQNYLALSEVYKEDPIALKILDYAKMRVSLLQGWVFFGSTRILPFEGYTKAAYQPDTDILHIFRHLLDDEHKQSYLYEALVTRPAKSARYLASLNLPDLAVGGQNSLTGYAGDLAFFNRELVNDLYVSVTRVSEDHVVSPSDLLFRILQDALSSSRSRGVSAGDRGPLVGLLLNVAVRLPITEKRKFFDQVEALIERKIPLIALANFAPFIPYFNPEREVLLRQIQSWLAQRWRKPPPSRLQSFCSKILGIEDE